MGEYIYLGLAVLAAICWLIGYRLHLNFGRDALEKSNNDPAVLKAAAEFARSYRSANFKSFTDAIAKLARRGRRSIELRPIGCEFSQDLAEVIADAQTVEASCS